VPIELDKTRHLRFTLNAMIECEERTGRSMLNTKATQIGLKDLRVYVWAALIHEDPTLTPEQVGDMIDLHNLADVSDAFRRAFSAAMPEAKGEQAEPETPLAG
jgi:hypothetical protein